MVKVQKIIEAEQQLCLAHGIQLAVLDVLPVYCRQATQASTLTTPQPSAHEEDDNSDADGEDDAQEDLGMEILQDYDVLVEMSPEYHNIVTKV